MKLLIGSAMIAAPYLALAIYSVSALGILPTIAIFGGVAFLIGWVALAVRLLA